MKDEFDFVLDGAPMDPDNRPPEAESYKARSFADPEWTPRGFQAADMMGAQIDPMSDATEAVINWISQREKDTRH